MLMRVPPSAATLEATTTLLRPAFPELTTIMLLAALRQFDPQPRSGRVGAKTTVALTIREACKRLAVSRSTLWRLVRAGKLPAVRVGNRAVRIPDAAVEDLLSVEPAGKATGSAVITEG